MEDLDYPKDKMFWKITTDHNSDDSPRILKKWVKSAKDFYADIDLQVVETPSKYPSEVGPHDWGEGRFRRVIQLKEECLTIAKKDGRHTVLFIDADQFLMYKRTIQALLNTDKIIIAPVLKALNSNYSNFWGARGEDGYYRRSPEYLPILKKSMLGVFKVPMVHSTWLVDMRQIGSAELTFEPDNLPKYKGPIDDLFTFAESCSRIGVKMFVINNQNFGYLIEQPGPGHENLMVDLNSMIHLATEALFHGPPGLLYSPLLDKPFPPKTSLGFDKIYLINLPRRSDRRQRMQANFDVLGINVTVFPAVDGSKLNPQLLKEQGMKQIKEYKDPFHKRPMTMGEVGCFLSHYNIWKDVIDNKYQRVLLIEDDLRFVKFFQFMLDVIMEDLEKTKLNWDLIYLGRKRLNPDNDGPIVNGHRYLTQVSYSYWTLAYALSFNGAKKLVDEGPLTKLVPVDEYLPIMYNKHPEYDWSKHYKSRNLKAFTAEPLLVHPTHYTGDEGYISDTEDTPLAHTVIQPQNDIQFDPRTAASRDEL